MDKEDLPQVTGLESNEGNASRQAGPPPRSWSQKRYDLTWKIHVEQLECLHLEIQRRDVIIKMLRDDLSHTKIFCESMMKNFKTNKPQALSTESCSKMPTLDMSTSMAAATVEDDIEVTPKSME